MKTLRILPFFLLILLSTFFAIPVSYSHAASVSIKPVEIIMKPGDKYNSSILVQNPEKETIYCKVYLGDWRQTDEGNQYLEVGKVDRSLSKWTQLSHDRIAIPPGESKRVYYEINIPEDPELYGSYWGILFIEEESRPAVVPVQEKNLPGLGINIVVRHGLKIYATISETGKKKAEFVAAKTVNLENGGFEFKATFENQGNTYLRPNVWLELRDRNGKSAHKINHRQQTILPGIKREYKFGLTELEIEPGFYTALIIADYDVPMLIAAQAEIEVTEQ